MKPVPLLAALAAVLSLMPAAAAACSVEVAWPRDPALRFAGRDMRRVTGTYRLEPSQETPGVLRARITTRRGTWVDVDQPYHWLMVECQVHDLPLGDAEGVFYLSRRSRNGRYRVLGWSGQYIPGLRMQVDYGEEGRQ